MYRSASKEQTGHCLLQLQVITSNVSNQDSRIDGKQMKEKIIEIVQRSFQKKKYQKQPAAMDHIKPGELSWKKVIIHGRRDSPRNKNEYVSSPFHYCRLCMKMRERKLGY